ncbi:porphyrin biosynthesis [Pelagibacter phage HTVC008M]|uniref:porphyrin biosynthesis n=1 Tax=Pelagibacter phage HTVC008M TaxID=1283076 RepID=UPI0002B29BE0|nr:porphyrin biosynthesis [Pelagibacter phage HTVC008M]AGE60442.1 cobalt chelatase subunit [Pelagibacter phage HTVC008M]
MIGYSYIMKKSERTTIMLNEKQKKFVDLAVKELGTDTVTRKQVQELETKFNLTGNSWLVNSGDYKVGRGVYKLPTDGVVNPSKNIKQKLPKTKAVAETVTLKETAQNTESLVPNKEATFVSFGNYKDIKNIVKSKIFYPTFITGLSGNGKTLGVTQACAELKRELIRVNITVETDEDDLLGGFRLVDGATVWHDGPVVDAMKRGALLLLDEIDLASNKIMCLQPILEGNGVFLKKIGKFVEPAEGFNIVATANTKGKGSEDGRFIGTNILNEAFLERFPVTFEQEYPPVKVEQKILDNVMSAYALKDPKFTENLVKWADVIRKTFYDGGVDEIIATRRLVHIINAFAIFKNKLKAVQVCVNRFDDDTKNSFLDLYSKVDAGVNMEDISGNGNDVDPINMEEETPSV